MQNCEISSKVLMTGYFYNQMWEAIGNFIDVTQVKDRHNVSM